MDVQDLHRQAQMLLFKSDLEARVRLWRKLEKLLSDGIPIVAALQALRDLRPRGEAMHFALNEWAIAMANGRSFHQAIGGWVNSEEKMMVMAGDQAGALAQSLRSMIKVAQARQKIRGAVRSGLAYPTVLMLVTFGGLYLFSYKMVPAFTQSASGVAWTGMARTVVDVAGFVQGWLFWMLAMLVCLLTGVWVSLSQWAGRSRVRFDRHVPYSIYRVVQGASWIIALSAMIESGLRIESAMGHLMRSASPWAQERIGATLRALKSGFNIGQALSTTGYEFPDREIIADLHIYGGKSGFDEALKLIADDWISQSVEKIERLMKQVFNVALVTLTLVIAFQVTGLMALQMQFSSQVRQINA